MTFAPNEIIFAATEACNLHCPHCFVSRTPENLSIDDAIKFLDSCKGAEKLGLQQIEKIGFSGGEPFLYLDFIVAITKYAVKNDLMFDQIMTNGVWWQNYEMLSKSLQALYDAGYDGKFGLSWDIFHNQSTERIHTFIDAVIERFGFGVINIQSVVPHKSVLKNEINKKLYKKQLKDIDAIAKRHQITVYKMAQSFPGDHAASWKSRKWFPEDYCQGPGHILYIHPDGNIAPCCGFANEDKALFIGSIKDDFPSVMENAENNKMVNICYNIGLLKYKDTIEAQLKKNGEKLPGISDDICSFCDYVCKHFV